MIPLFVIVLLLEKKPLCQTKGPRQSNSSQQLSPSPRASLFARCILRGGKTVKQFKGQGNLGVEEICPRNNHQALDQRVYPVTCTITWKQNTDSYSQNQILHDDSNTLF